MPTIRRTLKFIYDNQNRLIQRNDGIGAYRYLYDGNDNLTAVDGPWATTR